MFFYSKEDTGKESLWENQITARLEVNGLIVFPLKKQETLDCLGKMSEEESFIESNK